jgi:hypothetical protein
MASHWTNAFRMLAFLVAATLGCSTAYMPRPSRRISLIESGGALNLTRDSQTFGIWNVEQAVAGNPQAESEARAYTHHTAAGLILDFGGIALIGTGIGIGGQSVSSTRKDVSAGLVVGGLVSITAAIALIVTGVSHLYDAVNIYNDGLPPEAPR